MRRSPWPHIWVPGCWWMAVWVRLGDMSLLEVGAGTEISKDKCHCQCAFCFLFMLQKVCSQPAFVPVPFLSVCCLLAGRRWSLTLYNHKPQINSVRPYTGSVMVLYHSHSKVTRTDGLWNIKWNKLFPPQVAFSHGACSQEQINLRQRAVIKKPTFSKEVENMEPSIYC